MGLDDSNHEEYCKLPTFALFCKIKQNKLNYAWGLCHTE